MYVHQVNAAPFVLPPSAYLPYSHLLRTRDNVHDQPCSIDSPHLYLLTPPLPSAPYLPFHPTHAPPYAQTRKNLETPRKKQPTRHRTCMPSADRADGCVHACILLGRRSGGRGGVCNDVKRGGLHLTSMPSPTACIASRQRCHAL
jgi:hypothetical protein